MTHEQSMAILSLAVYTRGVDQVVNRPLLLGWDEVITPDESDPSGLAYGVYKNQTTGEVVISFRGTDAGWDIDWASNAAHILGMVSSQAVAAAVVYARVLKDYGSNISFTGHSLGGGLASLMGVWFDRPAVVFDPAPVQDVALLPLDAARARNAIEAKGLPVPDALTSYSPTANFASRELRVSSYHAVGESLDNAPVPRNASVTIVGGVSTAVQFGNENMSAEGMHSQALLTAGLLSKPFADATVAVRK